jgi:L-lactate dehydrogenase (cytochrome)
MEDVRAAGATSWFQACIPGEDDRIASLLDRFEPACFDTLVVTVTSQLLTDPTHRATDIRRQ